MGAGHARGRKVRLYNLESGESYEGAGPPPRVGHGVELRMEAPRSTHVTKVITRKVTEVKEPYKGVFLFRTELGTRFALEV